MTEAKRPLKIFLCHAHIIPLWDGDRAAVRASTPASQTTAWTASQWLDREKLIPSQDWVLIIRKD